MASADKDAVAVGSAADLAAIDMDEAARQRVEELIEEEEGATNRIGGTLGQAIMAAAAAVSVFHLYAAVAGSWPFQWAPIIPTYLMRPIHVGLVLALIFLLFPMLRRFRHRITPLDWLCAALSLVVIAYVAYQGEDFGDRAIAPDTLDYVIGLILIVLLLEGTRRSTGWIMPVVSLVFVAYALFGNHLPAPWTHRGYTPERLVGHLYMTLEGIFGTTVEVSSSLIILFTIFGAVLQHSGAGKFFIDFSFAAMGGKRNAAGRAVVLSSFLLGGPSGSGVATTVTIGTVAYPMLEKAGYEKNAAGGLLAAGGLGAIISPPVLGAAAFLIAEFLKLSYLDVIAMAVLPTLLYYFAILVMVELDAAKYGGGGELLIEKGTLWRVTRQYWYHFGSLISIIAFMLYGFSPVVSVFWATMLAIAVSYLRRDTTLVPRKLFRAMAEGTTGVLNVAA
ncbi:MAG: TRAP transporter permease, partial [Hyphomicrobiaceae bacterium]